MTTQVWLPQRLTPDALVFSPPASIGIASPPTGIAPGSGGSSASTTTPIIDLRKYVTGGRLPYKFKVANLPTESRYAPDRGIVTLNSPAGGQFSMGVDIYDAFGTHVSGSIIVFLAQGPLSVLPATNAYPDVHNGVAYDYTPQIQGGTPGYNCVFQGINWAAYNMVFDSTSGRLYSPSVPVIAASSLGNIWQMTTTDSATPAAQVIITGTINLLNP